MHGQGPFGHQFFDGGFYGGLAQGGAQLHELALGELAYLSVGGPANDLQGRELLTHQSHSILKLPIGGEDDAQKVLDKRGGVFLALVPALLTLGQGIVVGVLILGDLAFQGDILAYHITRSVEQQRGQKAAHAAIAVVEGVDAQEVVDEDGNEDQRIQLLSVQSTGQALADGVDSARNFIGGKGSKQYDAMPLGIRSGDIILGILKRTADPLFRVLVEIAMELEDIVGRDRDILIALVDGAQHIPVAHDLPLVSVSGRCLISAELFEPGRGGTDPLNFVGGLGTLDLGDFDQPIQSIGQLLEVQLLPPLILVDLGHIPQDLAVPGSNFQLAVIKGSHLAHLAISYFIP